MGERVRSSLFFVPMLAVVLSSALGVAMLRVDVCVDTTLADLPLGLASTVESARTVLSVVAGATISFAGIAFSVSLLIIQLASSQYSPRVVHALFRDPFTKRIMALVVGTFVYCLVVLRSVRSTVEPGGDPVIPNISVAVAVVLGIATILGIVAFINHSAHAMDVSDILERIRREATERICAEWAKADPCAPLDESTPPPPSEPMTVVRSDRAGWVQQVDVVALAERIPAGCVVHVETHPGRYVIRNSRLVTITPSVDTADLGDRVQGAFALGATRTMQQDLTFGLRQLVDVTVKALSPGINDPTTAQDAIFHTAAVLGELLHHDPPQPVSFVGGCRVVLAHQPSHSDLVRTAYDEPRRAAVMHPTVCVYLLASLVSLIDALEAAGLGPRTRELRRQGRLILAGTGTTDPAADDARMVPEKYADAFTEGGG